MKIMKVITASCILALAFCGVAIAQKPEQMLKVGLVYGNPYVEEAVIQSPTGFDFVVLSGNLENTLMSMEDTDKLTMKKAKYHIQVNTPYMTYESMLKEYEALKKKNSSLFYGYDDGWRIFSGSFDSSSSAKNAMSSLKKTLGSVQTYAYGGDVSLVDVEADGKLVLLMDTSDGELYFKPHDNEGIIPIVTYNDQRYRGGIGVKRFLNSDLTVINYISMDKYLYGVVPKEMSGDWPVEALKAQAVAARNYAMSKLDKHGEFGFDVCTATDCQVYGGYGVEKDNSNIAVDLTKGKLLKYNGKLVEAYFHSNSGGHTEDVSNIWSATIPYIVGVEDRFSVGMPNDTWELTMTAQEISSILESRGYPIGTLKSISVGLVSENGRVQQITFNGTKGKAVLSKEKIRAVFGYTKFRSIWYTVDQGDMVSVVNSEEYSSGSLSQMNVMTLDGVKSVDTSRSYSISNGERMMIIDSSSSSYTFRGKGFGHGLGMSQWGAKNMAEQGYSYEEILLHYYSGTYLE